VYTAIAQNWSQVSELGMTLVVRGRERPEALTDLIRSTIRDVDPGQAVFGIKTMESVVAESLSAFTLSLSILSAFAVLAIVLALSGTYGGLTWRLRERVSSPSAWLSARAGRGSFGSCSARDSC
jgi:hypothetical protein